MNSRLRGSGKPWRSWEARLFASSLGSGGKARISTSVSPGNCQQLPANVNARWIHSLKFVMQIVSESEPAGVPQDYRLTE